MLKNNPLVSVIIPTYNCEKYIYETIVSVIHQTYDNIQIIIVDDGSTDKSVSIIKSIHDRRILLLSKKRSGGSSARNLGFLSSKGEFIQYLDSDDLLEKNKIKRQLEVAVNQKYLISGPYYRFINDISDATLSIEAGYKNYSDPFDWVLENFQQKTMFPPNAWLIPKELILSAGKWNGNLTYNDDSEFFTRIALASDKIVFVKDAISYYRRANPSSVSHRKDYIGLKSRLLCINLISEEILKRKDSILTRSIIAEEYSKFIFSLYPKYQDLIFQAKLQLKKIGSKPKRNFYNRNNLSFKLSKMIGWKTLKFLKYFINRIHG